MPRKSPEQRLSNYKIAPSGCWVWQGAHSSGGYGRLAPLFDERSAHRASYILHIGPIPEGQNVLHECDNRSCVNPAHLTVGSQSQNMKDAYKRRRLSQRGNRNGNAKLTADKAEAIRTDPRTCDQLAAVYGVSRSAIGEIKRGRNWISADANARSERKL